MAATRTQLTTYLAGDDQLEDWKIVKAHYGESIGDAVVVRQLIHDKAMDIRNGNTKRQAIERIEDELRSLRNSQAKQEIEQSRQLELLRMIGEKVGVVVV